MALRDSVDAIIIPGGQVPSGAPEPPPGYEVLAFFDNFESFDKYDPGSNPNGRWRTSFHWGAQSYSEFHPEEFGRGRGGINGERQWYSDNDTHLIEFDPELNKNVLRIKGQKRTWQGYLPDGSQATYEFTSGMIATHPNNLFKPPVYIEARIKFPKGKGIWPAIWLYNVDNNESEIDIAELSGAENWNDGRQEISPRQFITHSLIAPGTDGYRNGYFKTGVRTFAAHGEPTPNNVLGIPTILDGSDFYNTFGLEWLEDRLIFYYNRQKVWEYRLGAVNTPSQQLSSLAQVMQAPSGMYLIINLALNGPQVFQEFIGDVLSAGGAGAPPPIAGQGYTLVKDWTFHPTNGTVKNLTELQAEFDLKQWYMGNATPLNQLNISNEGLELTSVPGQVATVVSKSTYKFGYFECRMKCEAAPGSFPAFWLYPNNVDAAAGTNGGEAHRCEIDIMEKFDQQTQPPNKLNHLYAKFTVHRDSVPHTNQHTSIYELWQNVDTRQFHTYSCKWEQISGNLGRVQWYVDDSPVGSPFEFPWDDANPSVIMDNWNWQNLLTGPNKATFAWARVWQKTGGGGGGSPEPFNPVFLNIDYVAAFKPGTPVPPPPQPGENFPALGSDFQTPSGTFMKLRFSDEFVGVPSAELGGQLYVDRSKWITTFWQGSSARTLTGNGEAQYYMDIEYGGANNIPVNQRPNPFEFVPNEPKGILRIKAFQTPQELWDNYWMGVQRSICSGMLCSCPDIHLQNDTGQPFDPKPGPTQWGGTGNGYLQRFGYVELRAKLPRNRGAWPAFWMLPCDIPDGFQFTATDYWGRHDQALPGLGIWPPELDIFEFFGHRPTTYSRGYFAVSGESGPAIMYFDPGFDISNDFHTWGMEWNAQNVILSFDGQITNIIPTPNSMKIPNRRWYFLINLAVGGNWYASELNSGVYAPGTHKNLITEQTFSGQINGTPANPAVNPWDVDTASMPWVMEIDYFRAYEIVT